MNKTVRVSYKKDHIELKIWNGKPTRSMASEAIENHTFHLIPDAALSVRESDEDLLGTGDTFRLGVKFDVKEILLFIEAGKT